MHKIVPKIGPSELFVGSFKEINLLFIDGDHSIEGCDFDFQNYSPYVPEKGYLVFHDFDPHRQNLGPTWVIQNRVMKGCNYKSLGIVDSLWIGRKVMAT
jgi:hypothetical protein